jgi:DNA-binding transcriptional regulator GbsR (MarR family)
MSILRNFLKLDSTKLVQFVEKQASSFWSHARNTTLRNHVVDSSILSSDETLFRFLGPKSLKNFLRYCILVHYADEDIKFYLQLKLENDAQRFSLEDQFLISQVLSSKAEMLCFLLETQLWSERDFRGNILDSNSLSKLGLAVFKLKKTKIVHPKRKRGYHDHGSRVELHEWLPKHDAFLTEKHNQIETARERLLDTQLLSLSLIT